VAAMFVAAAGALFPVSAYGQHNEFKIDDELYKMYLEANKNIRSKECLKKAELMYRAAVAKGDKKAQCMARCIPMSHYYNVNDLTNLLKSEEETKRVAVKNNYPRYFYFAWTKVINFYLERSETYHALQKAKAMQKDAFAKKDAYGLYNSLISLGNIYWVRDQIDVALKYYEEAVEYCLEHLPEHDPTSVIRNVTICYKMKKQYDKALSYVELGVKLNKQKLSLARLLYLKAIIMYEIGNIKEFNEIYPRAEKLTSEIKSLLPYGDDYIHMRILHYILEKDYKSAFACADTYKNDKQRFEDYSMIYAAEGRSDKALEYHMKLYDLERKRLQELQISDLSEFSAEMGNARLRSENMQLELENTKAKLEQSHLMAEKERAAAVLKRLKTDNDLLEMRQQHTSDSLRMAEISAKKAMAESERQRLAAQHRQLLMTVGFMTLLFLLTIVYVIRSRQMIEKLEQGNRLLAIARDKAQESDRLKTMFIQNVSHEIRTPLNAIIGFTDIMVEPDNGLDDATREEYRNIVHHNSNLLTGLVDDILTLSDIQSGRQRPVITSFPCNDLCRVTMATVYPRKAADVALTFESEAPDTLEIETDEKSLGRILSNFLTNAAKFTTEGEIRFKCSLVENPGFVTFSVADTGPGVPKEKQDMLFRQFEKLNGFQQGMGLGLHISSLIAEQLKGRIGIDRSYTKGARFYIAIPSVWSES